MAYKDADIRPLVEAKFPDLPQVARDLLVTAFVDYGNEVAALERAACALIAADMAHESKLAMQNFRSVGDADGVLRHDHYRTRATEIHHAILARGETS